MTGLGYTVPAVLAVLAVGALEVTALRTGLFRRPAYWVSMLIVIGFQILVDGWLTKLSAPIVVYDDRQTSGLRFPFDIPVEDFLFGFALVTAVLLLWERQRERRGHRPAAPRGACGVRRRCNRIRPDGGCEPRLSRSSANVGAPHASSQRRPRGTAARRGVRHRRVDRRAAGGGAGGRDRGGRRVRGDAA